MCLSVEVNLIREPLVVFVCATAGQGDPPDNMKVRLTRRLCPGAQVTAPTLPPLSLAGSPGSAGKLPLLYLLPPGYGFGRVSSEGAGGCGCPR